MKYTISKKDIAIILGFIGILVLGLTYYFVYMGYSEKTEQLKNANTGLQSRVDVLQSIADQQDQLMADAKNFEQKSEEIFNHFPAGFRDEDGFMLAVDLQAVSPFDSISTVTNSDPISLYNFEDVKAKTDEQVRGYIPNQDGQETPADGDQAEPAAPVTPPGLECVDTVINCTCDYPSFKNAIAYLIDDNMFHNIKIQAVYDITTGILASTYTIRSPYVINTDKVYTEPEVPFIVQGTDNIFGTTSLHSLRPVTYGNTRVTENGVVTGPEETENEAAPTDEAE